MNVLVTGSAGFIGRNLCASLERIETLRLYRYDIENTLEELEMALKEAQIIFHLAGVNRPERVEEFKIGNADSTAMICSKLKILRRSPKFVLVSSIQAELSNPYGRSKLEAEQIVRLYSEETGADVVVYRLANLFGKWCRPNYNSVTATFCHNAVHNLPLQISDPNHVIKLTYIDDVIEAFKDELFMELKPSDRFRFAPPLRTNPITLEGLANMIQSFKEGRQSLFVQDFKDHFTRALYATYLSYLGGNDFSYDLNVKTDNRGSLAEFIKASGFGQIFVSRTKPGITRGDHYHHTKAEKFFVLEGEAIIRFRHIENGDVLQYYVKGENYRVLDIPPGYTHSIENIGDGTLVTLFWANEIFDPEQPDTWFEPVLTNSGDSTP